MWPKTRISLYGWCGDRYDGEKLKKEDNLILPASSPVVLDAPSYKERMFIKTKKNRKLLKTACEENKFPNFRFVNYNQDPGMEIIRDLIEAVKADGHRDLPSEIADLILDLTTVSSTVSMFQVVNKNLLGELKSALESESEELMINPNTLDLKQKIFIQYPHLFKRLESISKMNLSNGTISKSVKILVISLIDFTLQFYDSLPEREPYNYKIRRE